MGHIRQLTTQLVHVTAGGNLTIPKGQKKEGKTHQLPQACLIGIAMLGIALSRVITISRLLRLRVGCFVDDWRFIIFIRHISEHFFLVTIIVFGLLIQGPETNEGLFQLADQIEDATDETGLVHSQDLDNALHERLDTSDVHVVFQGLEQQVQIQRLFGRRSDTGIKKRLIQRAVETVSSDLVRLSQLLDQHESLDAGVEVGGMGDPEQGVDMLGKPGCNQHQ